MSAAVILGFCLMGFGAVLLIVCSLAPKIGALITTIPIEMLGGGGSARSTPPRATSIGRRRSIIAQIDRKLRRAGAFGPTVTGSGTVGFAQEMPLV